MKLGHPFVAILALFLGGLLGSPASAQLGAGSILGTVTDSTGAVVVDAAVTATRLSTGFTRRTFSNAQGQYSLGALTPGEYSLEIETPGFKSHSRSGITLQVDQAARIDVVLEVGDVAESIEVAAEAPLVQSENASLGAVIETRKITDLPLNGREFSQLALLVPGANTGAPGADNSGGFTISGLRAEQNAFQIDGTSNSDAFQNRITVQPKYRRHPGIQDPNEQLFRGVRQGRRGPGESRHALRNHRVPWYVLRVSAE